jgi:hypothetical protein
MSDEEEMSDGEECPPYYEHDYRKIDERDGLATYICRRCGAEIQEET